VKSPVAATATAAAATSNVIEQAPTISKKR
jgi:hypothetical protein